MDEVARGAVAPCFWSCPVQTDAASYVSLIAQGRFQEAYLVARRDNPLAAVCARICTAPCEEVCCRSDLDSPVAIRALKRFLTDRFEGVEGERLPSTSAASGRRRERVAIIGSGPAGLACAHDLADQGYAVTIYEAAPVAGGMLRLAVPESRLPASVIEAEVDAILAKGVKLLTSVRLGRDVTLKELWVEGYVAVFLAVGAERSCESSLAVKGGPRLLYASEFLHDVSLGVKVGALGRTAVVAGAAAFTTGPCTVLTGEQANLQRRLMMMQALDVATTARRTGAKRVTICTVESESEWPAVQGQIEQAKKDGIRFRHRVVAKRLIGGGEPSAVGLLRVSRLFDEDGRFAPVYELGSRSFLPADSVIVVDGRTADLSWLRPQDGLAAHGGRIIVDPDTLATTRPMVFAGGDAAFGPRDVVSAIADGKRAAASIDRELRGRRRRRGARVDLGDLEPLPCPSADVAADIQRMEKGGREPVRDRALDEEEARREALRCLHCAELSGV